MMMQNSVNLQKNMLLFAQKVGCAISACNANTLEQAQAIIQAAVLERSPVILQFSRRAVIYLGMGDFDFGLKTALSIGRTVKQMADIPIRIHFDHGQFEEVRMAVRLGFDSVMFDGAELPFMKNLAMTKALVKECHQNGCLLEAEVGDIPRADAAEMPSVRLTNPDQAAEFACATGVDSLAVSLGSVHAVKLQEKYLDMSRLAKIRTKVDCPLVLHGASGVTDESLVAGIRGGLCKINMATRFNQAFSTGVRNQLKADAQLVDPRPYLGAGRDAMVVEVRAMIRLFGASGLARQGCES